MFSFSKSRSKNPVAVCDDEIYYIKSRDYERYIDAVENIVFKNLGYNDDNIVDIILNKEKPPKNAKILINNLENAIDIKLKRVLNGRFYKYPLCENMQRDAIVIFGQSGSGKSYWANNYCRLYHSLYPKNNIIMITCNEKIDETFKGLPYKRLLLNDTEKVKNMKYDEATFKNSLVILDDIETNNKEIKKFARNLRDILYEKSRKHKTVILSIIHRALQSNHTITQNNECTGVVIFPRKNPRESRNILDRYFDLDGNTIKEIMNEKRNSWSIYVHKEYPRFYLTEKKIKMID